MRKNEKGSAIVVILVAILLVAVSVGGYFYLFAGKRGIERAIQPDKNIKNVLDLPRTEIVESGYNMELTIKPSNKNVISETVEITATQVSEEAAGVGFFVSTTKEGFFEGGQPNIGIDRSETDGWSNTFNTAEFENGEYYINAVAYPPGGEGDPLGIAQIPVEIKN